MSRVPASLRRRVLGVARAGLRGLPPATRELALALATARSGGPVLLPGLPAGPALVIAPHPDDEVIGPGGVLARHHDDGEEVRVLLLTSGGATGGGSGGSIEAVREEESRRALVALGVPVEPILARLPDGGLADRVDDVAAAITAAGEGVATALVPSPLDPHPDHAAAVDGLARSGLPDDVLVLGYEVWAAGPVDALVDVTGVFLRKQAALGEYRTALASVDYVRSASGLAAYRSASGMLGGRGFAEGFLTMPLGELRRLRA